MIVIIDQKLVSSNKMPVLFSAPSYKDYNLLTGAELQDILGDPRYVAERLLETSAKDADPRRRVESFDALHRFLVEAASPPVAREFLDRVLRRAVAGTLPDGDERAAIQVVEVLGAGLGLDVAQRAAILRRARTLAHGPDPGGLLPFWVFLIGQVEGTAETEFLLELEDARDPRSFTFNQGSR